MSDDGPLVSVVIPAYNAAKTVAETLASVSSQTHRNLEILVIDDGSKDNTAEVVSLLAVRDPRIRLVRQANGGVCAARNRGIAEAKGEYVAFLDADDLWRPTKTEKQLAAFARGGPRAGLAYTQFVFIDSESRIIGVDPTPRPEGNVLREICIRNIVGHGSSPMIRKSVLDHVGGFELALRQSCEDHLMYFRVAEHYDFVVVQEPLVGYRLVDGSMTSDFGKMLSSSDFITDEMLRKHPELKAEIELGRQVLRMWLLRVALRGKRYSDAVKLGLGIAAKAPGYMAGELLRAASTFTKRLSGLFASQAKPQPQPRFL